MCDWVKDFKVYLLLGYSFLWIKDKQKVLGVFKCVLDFDFKYKLVKEYVVKYKKKKQLWLYCRVIWCLCFCILIGNKS